MVGQATAFAPNYNKAVLAAARVFRLLDRKPIIDAQGQSGLRLVSHFAVEKGQKVILCSPRTGPRRIWDFWGLSSV